MEYAELSHPIDREALLRKIEAGQQNSVTGTLDDISPMLAAENTDFDNSYGQVLKFHGWEVPNAYVMYQTYKLHRQFKESYP